MRVGPYRGGWLEGAVLQQLGPSQAETDWLRFTYVSCGCGSFLFVYVCPEEAQPLITISFQVFIHTQLPIISFRNRKPLAGAFRKPNYTSCPLQVHGSIGSP